MTVAVLKEYIVKDTDGKVDLYEAGEVLKLVPK
ncbi:Protein of unknown function [Bacillus cytotoxicus]|nr:Protein of unknown function [Bacillus cytotoxicus]